MYAPNLGFADRLLTLLTERAMTIEELAKKARVSREVIEAGLRGKMPKVGALFRIVKALNTTLEWLLMGEDFDIDEEIFH